MNEYYSIKLQQGLEYQDFISKALNITNYSSKKYQYDLGENSLGIEIKLDTRFEETGNIYFETHEKTRAENANFVESGINRKDNSWLYLIGNYKKAFVFAKKYLPKILENCREVTISTSKGLLLPIEKAERFAIRIFNFNV